jgi:iron complex outermembrane receptor protein
MTTKQAVRYLSAGSLVALAATAGGQAAQVLDPVTVRGEAQRSLTAPSIDEAQRELRTTPGGASVIDPKSYESGRSATLSDALAFAPGTFVQPRFGADEARVSIRGSGIQRTFHGRGLVLLQDGVPLNLADGSFDMQAVEPLGLQHIEVLRGANALQYGATTLGGAIDFRSPSGHTADRLRLRGEAGSFDYYRLFGAVGGVAGDLDYAASVSYLQQHGYRDWSEQANARLFGNVGVRVDAGLETRTYVVVLDSDSQLPGTLTKAQLATDPRQANAGNLAGAQKRDFPLLRISNKTTLRAGDGWLEAGAFYSYKDLFHPIFQVLDQLSHDVGVGLRYLDESPVAGRRNRLVVGMQAQAGRIDDTRYQNVGGTPGALAADSKQEATNLSLYVENQHEVHPLWVAVLGAQATRATRKLEDRFLSNGDNSFDASYSQFSPKLGLRYEWSPQVDLFANLSHSFEPPSFAELAGGPNITQVRAQKGNTFEVGTRGFLDTLRWDIAYYTTRLEDELLALTSLAGQPLGTVNAARTMHQGIELGLVATIAGRFESRNSYLWNDFRFRGDAVFGDNRLPGIPRQLLRSELLWRPGGGWYVGPTLEWSPSDYPVDMANTLFADAYAIFGFKAGRQLAKGLSFFVEGRNLGDKRYAATTGVIADAGGQDSAQFWPGDGRAVYVGVEWRP